MFKRIFTCCIWLVTLVCMIVGIRMHTGKNSGSKLIKEDYAVTKELDGSEIDEKELDKNDIDDDDLDGKETSQDDRDEDLDDRQDDDDPDDDSDDHQDEAASTNSLSGGKNIGAFHKAEISTDVLDVDFVVGDSYHISYQCTEELKPKISLSSDTLRITQKGDSGWNHIINFGSWFQVKEQMYIRITVPKGTKLSQVNLSSDVGDIKLNGLEIDSLRAKVDTADIFLKSCTVAQGYLESDTGDITTDNGSIGQLQVKTDTGDVQSSDCSIQKLDCRTDTGDVELDSIGNISDYYLQLDTDGGNIEINEKGHGEKYTAGQANSKYQLIISTDTGDIEIE